VTLLEPRLLREVASGLHTGRARIAMPRWDFAANLELGSLLQGLGMTVPFSATAADFTGIADDLFIDQVAHRANITVDEFGTEAAAVTGLAIRRTSAPEESKTVIRADRAFAFAVVHLPTQTPLFTRPGRRSHRHGLTPAFRRRRSYVRARGQNQLPGATLMRSHARRYAAASVAAGPRQEARGGESCDDCPGPSLRSLRRTEIHS
jgi:hypothetical protein